MSLKDKGYIFGLGAFRRYEAHFDATIAHFDETFRPTAETVRLVAERDGYTEDQIAAIPVRTISDVQVNHRWAVMLKYAHDVHVNEHGGESYSVDKFEQFIDEAPQSDWDVLQQQYLDSTYLGQKLRVYHGIPKPEQTQAKKKTSASAKRSRSRTS